MTTKPTHPFPKGLYSALQQVNNTASQLDDVCAMPEAQLLGPKHRRLLQNTRNNLRRQTHILTKLTALASAIIYHHAVIARFDNQQPIRRQSPRKLPSPDKRPSNFSE